MCGGAGESFNFETSGVLRLDGIAEGVGYVRAPRDLAVAQSDVVGVFDRKTRSIVRLDARLRGGGAIVEERALELRGAIEREGDVVEGDVVDAGLGAAADADGDLGVAGHIRHGDV